MEDPICSRIVSRWVGYEHDPVRKKGWRSTALDFRCGSQSVTGGEILDLFLPYPPRSVLYVLVRGQMKGWKRADSRALR